VKPGKETDELEPRFGFAEDVWIFEAGLEDVGAVNELGLVEGKVYGDVVPLVMTQPFVGKNDVVSHDLCTVIVITSVTSATFRLANGWAFQWSFTLRQSGSEYGGNAQREERVNPPHLVRGVSNEWYDGEETQS
jgi:hypothetical protein